LAVLEQFLIDFAGCVLLVSHDRYFMDKLVDHLFIFEGNGVIRDYPGNYTQYRILEKSKQSIAGLSSDITTPKEFKVPEKEVVAPKPLAPEVKKSNEKMTFKEKHELENLNKRLPELEKEKIDLETKLNTSSFDYNEILQFTEALSKVNQELESAELRWLELTEKV